MVTQGVILQKALERAQETVKARCELDHGDDDGYCSRQYT